jgi:hypothetical protein
MLLKYVCFFVCLLGTVSCASSNDDGREVSCSFSQDSDALLEEASSHLSSPKPGSPEVTDSNNESKLSSDNDGNLSFNRIPPDIIRHISTFMEPKDVANWRNVNDLTIFSVPLKKTVEQTFNISGLDEIDDFEPELAYVMELVHTSHDHVLFFTALMEDVVGEKKPYVVLFCPLMLHLLRTFRQLNPRKLGYYEHNFQERFDEFVEIYMAKICIRKGQLDLFCEITRDAVGIASWALRNAVELGLAHFVEILLQHRHDIYKYDVGKALEYAAKNGHTLIVEILLQRRPDIPADDVDRALHDADYDGHTYQRRPDSPADDGGALDDAAQDACTLIVELVGRYQMNMRR